MKLPANGHHAYVGITDPDPRPHRLRSRPSPSIHRLGEAACPRLSRRDNRVLSGSHGDVAMVYPLAGVAS